MASVFFSNFEADASELLEHIEEMFPRYYTHSNIFSMLLYSNTLCDVTRRQGVSLVIIHSSITFST